MTDPIDQIEKRIRVLEENGEETEELVDLLLARTEKMIYSDPESALEFCERAYRIAKQISYTRGIGYGLGYKGFANYMLSNFDTALPLLLEALPVARSIGDEVAEARTMDALAHVYLSLGNHELNLSYGLKTLQLVRKIGDQILLAWSLHETGVAYQEAGDFDRALNYQRESLALFRELGKEMPDRSEITGGEARALTGIGTVFQALGDDTQALPYHVEALELFKNSHNRVGESRALNDLGRIYQRLGDTQKALQYHQESLRIREEVGNKQSQATSLIDIGYLYLREGKIDEALNVLHQALSIAETIGAKPRIFQAHQALTEAYEAEGDLERALFHLKAFHANKEELLGEQAQARIKNLQVGWEVERAEREAELARQKNVELNRLLNELKATQDQLIHAEKLASLGQLTAGIAHEIKNPLNFVNNFAALSVELVDEIGELVENNPGLTLGEVSDQLRDVISNLKFNAQKITEHGRRADSIVKNMLLHSRGRPGEPQQVNLNMLTDEYLTLAYHGMRAQNPDFNVTLERDFGGKLDDIEIVPQEIGRVLINILNNAFYAVHERRLQSETTYNPVVRVSTERLDDHIEIRVRDNGLGIAEEVRERIFEPFFTTKPSGSGTGLGLSLAYEIVTRGHGGTLRLETEPEGYTEFIITLPVRQKRERNSDGLAEEPARVA